MRHSVEKNFVCVFSYLLFTKITPLLDFTKIPILFKMEFLSFHHEWRIEVGRDMGNECDYDDTKKSMVYEFNLEQSDNM